VTTTRSHAQAGETGLSIFVLNGGGAIFEREFGGRTVEEAQR
jgi:hypothetical protein